MKSVVWSVPKCEGNQFSLSLPLPSELSHLNICCTCGMEKITHYLKTPSQQGVLYLCLQRSSTFTSTKWNRVSEWSHWSSVFQLSPIIVVLICQFLWGFHGNSGMQMILSRDWSVSIHSTEESRWQELSLLPPHLGLECCWATGCTI